MRGSKSISRIVVGLGRALNPRRWPTWWRDAVLDRLRGVARVVAYTAALLLAAVWLSSALATLTNPLFDLGKAHIGDAIIAFARHLSLSPNGIYMLAHMLVGIKLLLGTFLLMAVSAGIYGCLRRGAGGDECLDLALFLSAVASIVAAGPVFMETSGLQQVVGELMLCVIASVLVSFAQARHETYPENRASFAAAEKF